MATMASKIVESYFEEKGSKAHVVEDDLLKAGWNLSNNASIDVFMEFLDDTHVHLEGINYAAIPSSKLDDMYKVVNGLNIKYKNVKFVLISHEDNPENNTICLRDDAVIQLDTCGEEVYELVQMLLAIADNAYPIIMKALWA